MRILLILETLNIIHTEKNQIKQLNFSNKIINFLITKNVKLLLLRNSAASVIENELITYKNIVPIYNVITCC